MSFGGGDLDNSQRIEGGTDNTIIGNTGDRLRVEAAYSSSIFPASWDKKLRYDDMNASNGGVARNTSIATSATWTTIYSYSGSGYIGGLLINVDTFTGWEFRLVVDGDVIYSFVSEDLTTDTLYDVDDVTDSNTAFLGISKGAHDKFTWHPPLSVPMKYDATVVVQLRRPTAGAKRFQAGLIIIGKLT